MSSKIINFYVDHGEMIYVQFSSDQKAFVRIKFF